MALRERWAAKRLQKLSRSDSGEGRVKKRKEGNEGDGEGVGREGRTPDGGQKTVRGRWGDEEGRRETVIAVREFAGRSGNGS
jgi:hypothetical protein